VTQSRTALASDVLRDVRGVRSERSRSRRARMRIVRWLAVQRWLPVRLRRAVLPIVEDRRVLESVIFPQYRAVGGIRAVLFVGCDWYTQHYEQAFFADLDYWTLEPLRERRAFGARQHVVAALEDLADHFPPDRFDWIICNGVLGWGLDSPAQCERALAACHSRLRPGGHLLLGWNRLPGREPVPIEELERLGPFERHAFPVFGSWCYTTDTLHRHAYAFYRKPRPALAAAGD
jgi:SAM-dependent methyltransferase